MSDLPKRNPDSIFNQIEDVLLEAWDAGFAHGYGDGTQPGRSQYPTGEQITKIRRSEAAHLWQAADDPAVVEAVVLSGMLFPERASEPEMKQQRALAAGWILRVLTALIGPRPAEQESTDDR